MRMMKILSILGLSVGLCLLFEPIGKAQPKPETNPPVIIHASAAEKGHYHSGYA
jgi:hypothetical protein